MKRLLPKSLLGQMILLMAAALLVAQLFNLAFLLSGQQKLSLAQNEAPAIARFVDAASVVQATGSLVERPERPRRPARRLWSMSLDAASLVGGSQEDAALTRRLAGALRNADVAVVEVRAGRGSDVAELGRMSERRRERLSARWQLIRLSARMPDGRWLNGRLLAPRADPWLLTRLGLATLALYILVLGAVLWIATRIARPLRDLTRAAESFHGRREMAPVEPSGPSDLRRAIEAFNAMNRRVVASLDEKDRMLGAIGHDLRTPLASLRIRAEAMEPEEERVALVRTVEEMAETLEDILVLARTGRAREPARKMDLAALADAICEEFHALGAEVAFEDSARAVADLQPNLMRRAIRNLIDNGVKYGGRARVRVKQNADGIALEVDDDGPGIPEDKIDDVVESFARLEGSRSRETGGTGLGLAIARAVAEAHGGALRLENRPQGGLRASLLLPG